ncbi:MAG: zinc-ribbon domain-containing protein [Acetobacteraceae bacterium]|nr:zinc-ribbon domain-containing protein [Acetobacteraceae bacterium]
MYCTNCGRALLQQARFCPYCGAALAVRPGKAPPTGRPPTGRPPAARPLPRRAYIWVLVGVLVLALSAGGYFAVPAVRSRMAAPGTPAAEGGAGAGPTPGLPSDGSAPGQPWSPGGTTPATAPGLPSSPAGGAQAPSAGAPVPGGGAQTPAPGAVPPPSDMAATQTFRYTLEIEPETLDPTRATGTPELTVTNALFEGLTRLGPDLVPQPAMAASWEVSPDGLRYTFHLRREAKWSNGQPVTAEDFVYSWRRILDPVTAADYAYLLYYIKGAQSYHEGRGTAQDVGVRAKDALTLEVTLEGPCPYFPSLLAFPTFFPVQRATVEAHPEWAAEAATLVSNGPFQLASWERGSRLEMVARPDYWDRASVRLQRLVFYEVGEASTELTLFEANDIDVAENPPVPDLDRLRAEGRLVAKPLLGTYYYLFNTNKSPLRDARVRKALGYAIDRQTIVTTVTKGGQVPALAFVPPGITNPATRRDFREEGGPCFRDADVAAAQRLLAEAGFPGGAGLPHLDILYNTGSAHQAIAEAVRDMWRWRRGLGIANVTLTSQQWGAYLQARDQGNYQVARAGWLGDYPDPMTFLDMWITGGGNNDTQWGRADYDSLIESARVTADPEARFEAMHQAERLLMDQMPITPIYYYVDLYLVHPYVKGLVKLSTGLTEFKWTYIARH